MAITEKWNSRTLRDTQNGVVVERVFDCLWTNWDNQGGLRIWSSGMNRLTVCKKQDLVSRTRRRGDAVNRAP